jgi:hypothetical protein
MIGLLLLLLSCHYFFEPSKRYISIFLLFALATAAFQLIPTSFLTLPAIGLSKSYDWLLLFLVFLLLVRPSILINSGAWREFGNIKLFLALLIFLVLYSVFIENIEFSVALRVFRNFVFIVFILVFCELDKSELEKVFRLIVIATSVASVVYCLQNVVGDTLLNNVGGDDTVNYFAEPPMIKGVVRFYNLPVLVAPILFLVLYDKKVVPAKWRTTLIIPNALACLLSQHRNLILAVLICFIVNYIIQHKISFGKLAMVIFAGCIIAFGINKFTNDRLSEGFTDLQDIASNGITSRDLATAEMAELSTSKFRIYHFYERLEYIMHDFMHATFGLGLLTEDSRFVKQLDFRIGLTDETYKVTQVDTSDIAWSLFIINFGILGTIIFISVYTNLLKRFYSSRHDKKMIAGVLYIILLLFTSFYGCNLISQATFCMLMLFAAYQFKLKWFVQVPAS